MTLPEILELPEEVSRIKSLELKLGEYKGRIAKLSQSSHKTGDMLDAMYKTHVLSRLLKEKQVEVGSLFLDYNGKEGYQKDILENAIAVINDYCKNGGKNVFRGTGLKYLSSSKILE